LPLEWAGGLCEATFSQGGAAAWLERIGTTVALAEAVVVLLV
jgi:hypothetical protein